MNERIKELAEQARIKDHWSIDEGRYLTNYLNEQKFAELIVRECADVCLSQRDPANLNYKPSERFAEAVKQHFGVQ